MPTDNLNEAETAATPAEVFASETTQGQFSADDLEKARAQEKAKLYPQLEKTQAELASVKKILEEQQAANAERNARRAERLAQQAAEKKAIEEDEMSFKALLKTKEQEWQNELQVRDARIEEERQEREKAFALLQLEREYQELDRYRSSRIEQERDNIIPELIDLVTGNSRDEIEQSILGLKDRSAKIFESVQAASQQTRKEMVGTRITVPASGPLDNDSDSRAYSPNDISNMPMSEYAKNRSKLLGNSNNRGQGLFG
jgi:hypothetical protein